MSLPLLEVDLHAGARKGSRLAVDEEVEATLSWLLAMDRVAREHGVPLVLFLVPVASIDPEYARFWKPWPHFLSWNRFNEERHTRLAAALQRASIHFVDLRDDLRGQPGTYRKMDGHWTEQGLDIVSSRVQAEIKQQSAHK